MWIGNMHLNIVKGDFRFAEWEEDGWKDFRKKVHELRVSGYRKVGQEYDFLNYYEYYKKKGNKEVITITMMCC
jgi:hypothetical protein